MPTKATQQFTAWSYSRFQDYKGCPFKAKCKHLDKLPEPEAPALARGSEIHKLAEKYATGAIKKMPKELKLFADEFKRLRSFKTLLMTEQQLGLDAQWSPCSWFGAETWCRIVMDCMYDAGTGATVRQVVDYKTGKINPSHMEQLSLYAIGAFATAPKNIVRVDTSLWYLDASEERGRTFMKNEVPGLKKHWAKETKQMLADTTFEATPGNACRWCAYSKAKGGPCEF